MIQDKWLGKTLNERKDYIKEVLDNGSNSSTPVEIGENNFVQCQIHFFDINLPISRLSNIRTKSSQMNWLAENSERSNGFFSKDPECREALLIQQDLLFRIANSGDEKNFYENFKKGVKFREDEPIIINSKGVMINGNTRMSAIRKLLDEDELGYPHLLKIPMAILPPTVTEADERFLELRYQVRPDWQKNYSWVSEALDCKQRILSGEKIEKIIQDFGRDAGKKLRSNSVGHPQNLLEQLEVGDILLEALGTPGLYSKIDGTPSADGKTIGTQYAMWEWARMRSEYDDKPKEQALLDSLCVDHLTQAIKGDIEGRLLIILKDLRKNWRNNKEEFIEALNREGQLKEQKESEVNTDLDNKIDSEHTTVNSIYDELELIKDDGVESIEKPVLKKKRDTKKTVQIIKTVNSNIQEKKSREKDKSYIYQGIVDMKSKLSEYKKSLNRLEKEFSNLDLAENELSQVLSLLDDIKALIKVRNEG